MLCHLQGTSLETPMNRIFIQDCRGGSHEFGFYAPSRFLPASDGSVFLVDRYCLERRWVHLGCIGI